MAAAMHILIVEDDEGVGSGIAPALRAEGYRVSTATDVVAMRQLVKIGERIDAILLAASLSEADSASVASCARGLGVPVVRTSRSHVAMKLAEAFGRSLL